MTAPPALVRYRDHGRTAHMIGIPPGDRVARMRIAGVVFAAAALAAMGVTLAGFLTPHNGLLRWLDSSPPIRANAALGLALLAGGVLVWAFAGERLRALALALPLFAAAIGAATLVEDLGVPLGIDRLLYHPAAGVASRPAVNSAIMLVILGGSASLLSWSGNDRWARRLMHGLAVVGAIVGVLGVIGYTSGATSLYTLGSGAPWAFPSVVGDLLVAFALLCLHSELGLMRILVAPGPGGRIARGLLGVAIFVPIGGQAASQAGMSSGLFSAQFGDWLVAVLTCTLLAVIVLMIALQVETLDRDRARSESRYREFYEGSHDAIFAAGLDSNLIAVNPAAERLVAFDRAELLSMSFFDLIAPEEREESRAVLARNLAGEPDEAVVLTLIAKNGRRVIVEVTGRVVEEDGEPVRIEGTARDISERRALEQQYLQAQKMESVGRLAGGVAHDFNNLLTAIFGYTELALLQIRGEEPQLRRPIEQVHAVAERARDITKQLLAFSRQQPLSPQPVSLRTTVDEMLPLLERLLGDDIEITHRTYGDIHYCTADPASLDQMLLNLAVNARDAMPDGGRIEITTGPTSLEPGLAAALGLAAGTYLTLTVSDTGTGIDGEVLEHIFEPFFTTKPVGKGSGLGLSTLYGIVHQLEGAVTVESTLGEGTTFTIHLPVSGAPAGVDNPDVDAIPIASGGGRSILLVEDEDVVRELVTEILSSHDYNVSEASTPSHAISLATQKRFDMLVTDVVMPKRSGISLADELRTTTPGLPVVFLSGYSAQIANDRGLVEGPNTRFLQKPFSTDELLRTLTSLQSERSESSL